MKRRKLVASSEHLKITFPVKMGTGVSFALGRDVGMARNVTYRIDAFEAPTQSHQGHVLLRREWLGVTTFQFDPYRKIVATRASAPCRNSGMPRALVTRDKLNDQSVASNQKMGGHPNALELLEIRVLGMIQLIGKKSLDLIPAILIGGEADVVNDQQINGGKWRPGIKIG
jgi:hypothetical protein